MKPGLWEKAALLSSSLFGEDRRDDGSGGLSLRRVMLSTGGVGYFEYEGKVTGDGRISLGVRIDQVDDVLKSIVVYDSAGNLGEIVLPGKDLTREVFRDLPFNRSALDSAPALIAALRGAEVRAETMGGVIEGRIVSVTAETSKLLNGEVVTKHRLAIAAAGAVRQVILEEVETLKFLDPAVRAQIEAATLAMAQDRDRGRRELSIRIAGTGERVVRVAYVAAVPLWKMTYRFVVPAEASAGTARIEGFAVVENRSGADWTGVDLTLLSGNPVTFRQALYAAYDVERPEVPVDMVRRVLPKIDAGATAMMGRRRGPAPLACAGGIASFAPHDEVPAPAAITPAEGREAATQVVFHLRAPVTIADGQSALLPVVSEDLPVDRWSLYSPSVDRRSPLSSARIKNTSKTDLPPGAMAVFERDASGALTYMGDARLGTLPVGEDRIVSYAVDERVKIRKEDAPPTRIVLAKIAQGVLTLTRIERQATTYTITGAAREPRTVVIEHPLPAGWTNAAGVEGFDQPFEITADQLRFRKEVDAGKTATVKVLIQRPTVETLKISDLSDDQITAWVTGTDLSPDLRAAFARIASLRAAIAARQAQLTALEEERKQITLDQARIRENLKAVPAGSDLAKGYLATLTDQEQRLRALGEEIKAARDGVAKARQELAVYVSGLSL